MDERLHIAIAKDVAHGILSWDEVRTLDGYSPLIDEPRIVRWVGYVLTYEAHERAMKRAMPLLRSYLTREQRDQLRKHSGFRVEGSAGGMYRLYPHGSNVSRCLNINGRWFDAITFCYHDPEGIMCTGDEALGRMLKLMTDEVGFLKEANISAWRLPWQTIVKHMMPGWSPLPPIQVGAVHMCQIPEYAG